MHLRKTFLNFVNSSLNLQHKTEITHLKHINDRDIAKIMSMSHPNFSQKQVTTMEDRNSNSIIFFMLKLNKGKFSHLDVFPFGHTPNASK